MTNERRVIADGLAAIAISSFEMGKASEEVAEIIVGHWEQLGSPPGALSAAADAVRSAPQPVSETPERLEATRSIRERLGVQPADDQLLAAIAASELLRVLSAERDG